MRWRALDRWLPALGLVAGLLLMAAAAVSQESQSSGAPAEPTTTAQPDAPRHGDWRAGAGRRQHFGGGGRFVGMSHEAFCKERFARKAGFLAYLGAELDLTAAQQPLWDAYHQAMMDAANKQRQACLDNIMTPDSHLTSLERRDRLQRLLQARLDGLQSTRASLEALYQSLSPEQRQQIDRPFQGWARRRGEGER
jgi:LTXXQ motif family protein